MALIIMVLVLEQRQTGFQLKKLARTLSESRVGRESEDIVTGKTQSDKLHYIGQHGHPM